MLVFFKDATFQSHNKHFKPISWKQFEYFYEIIFESNWSIFMEFIARIALQVSW